MHHRIHPPLDLPHAPPVDACLPAGPRRILFPDAATSAEMQSRVHQELHQRRLAAARITGSQADRTAFVTGLLEDTLLLQDACASFLANARRAGIHGDLFTLAAEEATATVLRTAFRRTDDLLDWQETRAPLAGWWGLQALYDYNNDGRRQAERRVGYRRSSNTQVNIISDHQPDDSGTLQALPLPDESADPAERYERAQASADLEALLACANGHPALAHLREWLEADALNADAPVTFKDGQAHLTWRYGAQQSLAQRLGVTTRTLRNRVRAVEALLVALAALARAA